MFNLIMSGNGTAWETDQFMRMDAGRYGEYSIGEWTSRSINDPQTQRMLETLPALLLYEAGCSGPTADVVRFGYAREIKVVDGQILFRFEERGHLSRTVLNDFADRLGIGRFEQNRTHWAVKDGGIPSAIMQALTPTPFGSKITEVTRRAIVDFLIRRPSSFHGDLDSLQFLKRIWDLASMPSTDRRFENAEADIWQHTVNNVDWDDGYLLNDYLGLLSSADKIFLKFVELAVHPLVGARDEVAVRVREINTHLKLDGFRLIESSQMSSRPIFKAQELASPGGSAIPVYEIVLSFAGEDRVYVEEVADFLLSQGVDVFYDRNEEATLWGKDLAEHLDSVYRKSARFCVMFISKHYAEKIWPNHERRSALARALEERQEYILPARFDDTEIPGIRPTLGYIELSRKTPRELGTLILQKLGRHVPDEPIAE
ncbi:MAG TPA: TIR domain-containing protein [Pirellulaceae bacterium]|nr:TIR domain-containing protein [Pirellulaceae bacterium]